MKRRRLTTVTSKGKGYSIVLLFVCSLIVWQLTKLSDEYSETSAHTIKINEAVEPYLYRDPVTFPSGLAGSEADYLKGHKEGWYTVMRTSHHSPDSDERPLPPYQIPDKYFEETDDHLSVYEKGFRDGCFLAEDTIHKVNFNSPRKLRKDIRKAFSSKIIRETPSSVINALKEMGYDFES